MTTQNTTTTTHMTLAETQHVVVLNEIHARMHHPDFRHGFAYNYLTQSRNQAFNFAYAQQIPVPSVGPEFRITLPNGDEYMRVQWGVTHLDIQCEINDEPDFD